MSKRLILSAALAVLALPATASAGTYTLHPAGFGENSYTAWKAKQGLPDSRGNDDQALYFQKQTLTTTYAAGVAIVKGVEGVTAGEITGLAWTRREDGHCGNGAPRWNVTWTYEGQDGLSYIGCYYAEHEEQDAYGGHGWCRDTFSDPGMNAMPPIPDDAVITSLSIVFDEGNEIPSPPTAGCEQEPPGTGYVHLDDITIEIEGSAKCWTGASDNGNNSTAECPPIPEGNSGMSLPTIPTVPAGVAVNATDTSLVSALRRTAPNVALTSWRLFPGVY